MALGRKLAAEFECNGSFRQLPLYPHPCLFIFCSMSPNSALIAVMVSFCIVLFPVPVSTSLSRAVKCVFLALSSSKIWELFSIVVFMASIHTWLKQPAKAGCFGGVSAYIESRSCRRYWFPRSVRSCHFQLPKFSPCSGISSFNSEVGSRPIRPAAA